MKENETCDPCERDFIESVDRLVEEVDDYTAKDRREKKEEVEAAFENGAEAEKEPCRPCESGRDS